MAAGRHRSRSDRRWDGQGRESVGDGQGCVLDRDHACPGRSKGSHAITLVALTFCGITASGKDALVLTGIPGFPVAGPTWAFSRGDRRFGVVPTAPGMDGSVSTDVWAGDDQYRLVDSQHINAVRRGAARGIDSNNGCHDTFEVPVDVDQSELSIGRKTSSTVPWPTGLVTSIDPPKASTRSRRPVRPVPWCG